MGLNQDLGQLCETLRTLCTGVHGFIDRFHSIPREKRTKDAAAVLVHKTKSDQKIPLLTVHQ